MPKGVRGKNPDGTPKKPAEPRPVYIVYDLDTIVGNDGKLNQGGVLLASRNSKEALEFSYSDDGTRKGLFRIMLR